MQFAYAIIVKWNCVSIELNEEDLSAKTISIVISVPAYYMGVTQIKGFTNSYDANAFLNKFEL